VDQGGRKPPVDGSDGSESFDVFSALLIRALAEDDMFRESIRSAPLNECQWGVHVVGSDSAPPNAETNLKVPFDTKVATRAVSNFQCATIRCGRQCARRGGEAQDCEHCCA
jgi:hypothetical protein